MDIFYKEERYNGMRKKMKKEISKCSECKCEFKGTNSKNKCDKCECKENSNKCECCR